MSFDIGKFETAKFAARTRKVPVSGLVEFFPGEEKPEWEVRGLNSRELFVATEASTRQNSIEAIVKAIAVTGDKAQSIRDAIGLSGNVPGEMAKRLEMLVMGSVAPKIELSTATKLAEVFPIEFLTLTNVITELTGLGFDLVKPAAA
jgi:hypothetical protein